jgi:hypothetical protein
VLAGVVAAMATAGALVGFGLRDGAVGRSFVVAGGAILSRFGIPVIPNQGAAVMLGVLLHFAWIVALGVCFAVVARTLRGAALILAAVVFAGAVYLLADRVIPSLVHATLTALFSTARVVFVHVVLALGLAAGMRLARQEGASR